MASGAAADPNRPRPQVSTVPEHTEIVRDDLSGQAKAGVSLLHKLIQLTAFTLAGFALLFLVGHLLNRSSSWDVIQGALRNKASEQALVRTAATDRLRQEVAGVLAAADSPMPPNPALQASLQLLRSVPGLDPARATVLERCGQALAAPPGEGTRTGRLRDCLAVIDGLRLEANAQIDPATLRLILELMQADERARDSYRRSLAEAAQMILLNLLLPLLTAVLGYTFGTQATRAARNGEGG